MNLPDNLTEQAFLREYWQRKPLLMRAALPGFESPLDGDELAGLACDAYVESRIVVREAGPRWKLHNGPFTEQYFAGLPDHDWTLLIQDVDKHLPDLAGIFQHFDFIPQWRIDDLMISWAADGGSVGPHADQYDVFLLQAEGRREWQTGAPSAADVPTAAGDGELDILEHFTPDASWVLEPGDMLYLPPGIPHHGIARGHCMTWSIGFRAPAQMELLADVADRMTDLHGEGERYRDPGLDPSEAAGGKLSATAIARAEALLDAAWAEGKRHLPRWFGETVTSPKTWLHCLPPPVLISAEALAERIRGGNGLARDPRARLLWFEQDGQLCLCADGRSTLHPDTLAGLLELVCTGRRFPAEALSRYLDMREARRLLADLYNGGQLVDDESR